MKLSDELKTARRAIETAMGECARVADARVAGSGVNYAQAARDRGETPQTGDRQAPAEGRD